MIKRFIDSIKQIVKSKEKRKGKKKEKQDSAAVLRDSQIVKPIKTTSLDFIAPTQYDITPQTAKSLLRQTSYVHIPPRDNYVAEGGDL